MLVLGLLLILGAAVITVGAIFDGGESASVVILGQTINTTAAGVFVAGLVTMLVFLIGVWLIYASLGRARRRRGERKEAKRREVESVTALKEERAALQEENERLAERLSTTHPPKASDGTGAGAAAGATAAGAATAGSPDPHDTTGHDTAGHDTAGHDTTGETDTARYDAAGQDSTTAADDRVIDHRTDLTAHEATDSGRHRDAP